MAKYRTNILSRSKFKRVLSQIFICGGAQAASQASKSKRAVLIKTCKRSDVYTAFTAHTQAHSDNVEDLKDNPQLSYEEMGGEKQLTFVLE